MRYFYLLLVVCVFLSGCDPIVKEGVVKREPFSLARLASEIRRIDTAAEILDFKPDSGAFKYNASMLSDFLPDPVYGLKGNVDSMSVSEFATGDRGKIEQIGTVEYLFKNNHLVKMQANRPDDTSIRTFQYDAAGLLAEYSFINPGQNDSVTQEYQYDKQNRLVKILYFDELNVLVETELFFYNKSGNLDSIFDDNSEGASYIYKFFTNSASNSYLRVKIHENGKIVSAYYYKLADHGLPSIEEHYDKEGLASIYRTTYEYNSFGEMTKTETVNEMRYVNYVYNQSYRKRDSAGSWTEMMRYMDRDLHKIERRVITYK